MQLYEYKVIPAPNQAEKFKGVKAMEDRFAHTLMQSFNQLGREGWEYVRADALPCEERVGFTKKNLVTHHVLIFRRPLAMAAPAHVSAGGTIQEGPRLGGADGGIFGAAPALGPARPSSATE